MMSLLEERQSCSIAELAQRFSVSEETIRRDVRRLETSGRARKVHGGVSLSGGGMEAPFVQRVNDNAAAKRAIAAHCAELVCEGMTLLIDSGTTSLWFTRAISHVHGLTIITNSFEVAREVMGRNDNRLFFAGGDVNIDYRAAFGADAIALSRRFAPDLAILSIGAIEAGRGLLDFEPEEAFYKQAVFDLARRVILLADASKFGREGSVFVAGLDRVHDLVTDRMPPPEIIADLTRAGTDLHVVTG
ncbi:MAG: DeoR/GlpR family DNA-binding transcription regulator [Sphingobium sp.]